VDGFRQRGERSVEGKEGAEEIRIVVETCPMHRAWALVIKWSRGRYEISGVLGKPNIDEGTGDTGSGFVSAENFLNSE
jgi:hypothetical protein